MTEFFYELTLAPADFYDAFLAKFSDFGALEELSDENFPLDFAKFTAFPKKFRADPKHALKIASEDAQALQNLLSDAKILAQNIGTGFYFHLAKLKNSDWITAYKNSVQSVVCGNFYVRAPWHEPLENLSHQNLKNLQKISLENTINAPDPKKSAEFQEILIEPSLAFGTGHHESTFLAILLLQTLDLRDKILLDIGCGSGILGIIAAKMGAKVTAMDTDFTAVLETQKNVRQNSVKFHKILHGSLGSREVLGGQIFVANIQKDVIKMLYNWLKVADPEARVILSGLTTPDVSEVLEHYGGFFCEKILTKNDWAAVLLHRTR